MTKGRLNLSKNQPLRQAYLFFLYFSQGLPIALWTILVPHNLRSFGLGFVQIGIYMTLVMSPWVFGRLILGPLVDRYSSSALGRRRQWIVGGQVASLLSFLTMGILVPDGTNLVRLVGFATIINIGIAVQDTATDALAIDSTPPHLRGATTSFMFSGQVVGFSVGSVFAGWYWDTYQEISYLLFSFAMVFAMALLFTFSIRESDPHQGPGPRYKAPSNIGKAHKCSLIFHDLFVTFSARHVVFLALGSIAFGITLSAWNLAAPTYAADLGWSKFKLGLIRAVGSLCGALAALLVTGRIVDQVGAGKVTLWLVTVLVALDMSLFLYLPLKLELVVVIKDVVTQSLFIGLAVIIMGTCSVTSTASQFGILVSFPTMTVVATSIPLAMFLASNGYNSLWLLMTIAGVSSLILFGISFSLRKRT